MQALIAAGKRFSVIYADPPWQFHNWSHRGEGKGASQHYQTMGAADIAALPVAEIAAPDCALFMWVVQPQLPEALDLLKAWGFAFKTVAYAWVKIKGGQDRLFYAGDDVRKGLGYHTRSGMEQCWLAIRGDGYDRLSQGEAQVVFSPLREHSRKPDEVAESIVRLCGDLPRIELFARQKRPGWDVWGNETTKFVEAAE
jgi:N6-adenosine-specific RNA methylase IME4